MVSGIQDYGKALTDLYLVFNDRPNRNIKFYRDAIFPLGLTGSATFHTALANLAFYLRHARPLEITEEYEAQEELAHQAKVFNEVNKRIAKKDTSDDVVSAVAALACHSVWSSPLTLELLLIALQHVAAQMQTFYVHMNGLTTLIHLRGGIQTLDENKVVRNSLFWSVLFSVATPGQNH